MRNWSHLVMSLPFCEGRTRFCQRTARASWNASQLVRILFLITSRHTLTFFLAFCHVSQPLSTVGGSSGQNFATYDWRLPPWSLCLKCSHLQSLWLLLSPQRSCQRGICVKSTPSLIDSALSCAGSSFCDGRVDSFQAWFTVHLKNPGLHWQGEFCVYPGNSLRSETFILFLNVSFDF